MRGLIYLSHFSTSSCVRATFYIGLYVSVSFAFFIHNVAPAVADAKPYIRVGVKSHNKRFEILAALSLFSGNQAALEGSNSDLYYLLRFMVKNTKLAKFLFKAIEVN